MGDFVAEVFAASAEELGLRLRRLVSEATSADWFEDMVRCVKCGQRRRHDAHGKSYGGGSYTAHIDASGSMRTEITTTEPHHAPWQHNFEPGWLIPLEDF